MIRDFFLGFIKIHILHHATEEPIYGLYMIEELASHGYDLSPGTLYPILHKLEDQGYLQSEKRVVEGKVRRYYTATPAGEEALIEAYTKARELLNELGAVSPSREVR
jgi:PadR family transcriptional regulator PadR